MSERPDDKVKISMNFGERNYSFEVERKDARFVREAGRIADKYIQNDLIKSSFRHDAQDALSHLAIIYISQYLEMKENTDLPDLENDLKDIADNLERYNSNN